MAGSEGRGGPGRERGTVWGKIRELPEGANGRSDVILAAGTSEEIAGGMNGFRVAGVGRSGTEEGGGNAKNNE